MFLELGSSLLFFWLYIPHMLIFLIGGAGTPVGDS